VTVVTTKFEDFARSNSDSFDQVVMNPPFAVPGNPTIWIDHVLLAEKLLKRGGHLVAISRRNREGGVTCLISWRNTSVGNRHAYEKAASVAIDPSAGDVGAERNLVHEGPRGPRGFPMCEEPECKRESCGPCSHHCIEHEHGQSSARPGGDVEEDGHQGRHAALRAPVVLDELTELPPVEVVQPQPVQQPADEDVGGRDAKEREQHHQLGVQEEEDGDGVEQGRHQRCPVIGGQCQVPGPPASSWATEVLQTTPTPSG
jgi:hypothetical protein